MWSLADYKSMFMVAGLIGIIVFSVPSVLVFVRLPIGEQFSELYVLGSSHMADGYPFNVSAGTDYRIYLGVGNHMGEAEYYRVIVKFRNATEPLPNATENAASSLPELYAYNVFLSDGRTWEETLNFSFSDVKFGPNVSSISRMRINGALVNVDKIAVWNDTNNGFYYELFFELWIYDAEAGNFQYHNRCCGIRLNMTLPSTSMS